MSLLQIQKKLATGKKLTAAENLLWETHLQQTLHRKQERWIDTADGFHIHKSVDTAPLVEGVRMMSEAQLRTPTRDRQGRLYLGSIDQLTAVNWAKECGHPLYSKEWKEYALKKLRSNEFSHFRAERVRKYV